MCKGIRLGVVGLGHRGRAMFQLGCKFKNIVPAAVCELNPALWHESQRNMEPLAKQFPDTPLFDDYETMLRQAGLDAVIVETPADCHAQFCALALEHHIAVLSDIPVVRDMDEAGMLWTVGSRSPALYMTGATANMWGFVEAMADFYRQGLFGKLEVLEAEYVHDVRSLWGESPWRRTMMPILYCTHSLGPLLRLLESDLRRVSCFTTGGKLHGGEGENDLMTAQFQSDDAVIVRLLTSFINEAGCGLHSYRVFGTDGYFERLSERGRLHPAYSIFKSKKLYGLAQPTEINLDNQRPELAAEAAGGGHGGADYALFQAFFRALRDGDSSGVISLKAGLRMTIPGIFAARSAQQGGALLSIEYPWD